MIVLFVGPDGSGKTTVLKSLSEKIPVSRREHFRPFHSTNREPVTDPHTLPPRGLVSAHAKLVFLWVEQWMAYFVRRRAERRGIVIIERGWWDQEVDPRRYRLPMRALPAVRLLGGFLPQVDAAILFHADPDVVSARKPELDTQEVSRQMEAWRTQLPSVSRNSHFVETTTSLESSCDAVLRHLS